jgi:uncharacterized protein YbjQ (UPF0145 family)
MIVSTTKRIPQSGVQVKKAISLIRASCSESLNLENALSYDFQSFFMNGEIDEMTKTLNKASNGAKESLIKECTRIGGNAILSFRYEIVVLNNRNLTVFAYGTAVEI